LTFQCTASLLQPWIGLYTDRRPMPFLLPIGMVATLIVLMMSFASTFPSLLLSSALIGVGSSTFHPEASRAGACRVGRPFRLCAIAVPGRRQCRFGAWPGAGGGVIIGRGQGNIACSPLVAAAIAVLVYVSRWHSDHLAQPRKAVAPAVSPLQGALSVALAVLALLVFSKYIYMSSLTSYYTFYLIDNSACRCRRR
jgi:FSR family fosmidomycin resistance protein-like MFS transporter